MPYTERQKRNAVAQFLSGVDQATIAKRLGCNVRQIKRWVSAAKAVSPSLEVSDPVPYETPSLEVPASEKGPENPVLDELLKDEGAAAAPHSTAPTSSEVVQARVDIETHCVDAFSAFQATVGTVLIQMRFAPPLDPSSPEVLACLKVGHLTALAIRANAPTIYPILVKYSSTYAALAIACGTSVFGMIMGLEKLAKSKGWIPPAKKMQIERPASMSGTTSVTVTSVPSPEEYGASLRPQGEGVGAQAQVAASIADAPVAG